MKTGTIELFKPGTYTDSSGTRVTLGAAELRELVATYDPVADPAPIVVGHPELDDPAYGWVRSLAFTEGRVVAEVEKIEPAFAEAVNQGRYPRVSASFYTPDAASSPKPGKWYLKHIGFLGGTAPAVKGLGHVAFAAGAQRGVIALAEGVPAPRLASFVAPDGYGVRDADLALYDRARAIQSRSASDLGIVEAATLAQRSTSRVSFAAPDGWSIAERHGRLHARAMELLEADPDLFYMDAVRQADRELSGGRYASR